MLDGTAMPRWENQRALITSRRAPPDMVIQIFPLPATIDSFTSPWPGLAADLHSLPEVALLLVGEPGFAINLVNRRIAQGQLVVVVLHVKVHVDRGPVVGLEIHASEVRLFVELCKFVGVDPHQFKSPSLTQH